jgi:hypothetical protein
VNWFILVLGAVIAAVVIDRLMLAAEQRGWVYWRRRKPTTSAAGSAILSVQAIFEPDKGHVVEEQRRLEADIDVAGDDNPLTNR